MTQTSAQLKYLRVAPRKVRFVADVIRRLHVGEAEAQLMRLPNKPAEHILKLLRSAIANAIQQKMNVKKLFVKEIFVNEGPKLKRWMPRMGGRPAEIQKKMSHITLILSESDLVSSRDFIIPKKEKKIEKKSDTNKKIKNIKKKEKETKKELKSEEKKSSSRKLFQRKSV